MGRGKIDVLACLVLVLLMLYRFARLAYCSASLSPDGVALLEVKRSLNVTSTELQTWSESDASPCHWEGITCTESGFVETIHLPELKTTRGAVLSPTLGRLRSLTSIDFTNSGISGGIPPELGNLTRLTTLNLQYNSLTGTIPKTLYNTRIPLKDLILHHNNLTDNIGTVVDGLTRLRNITLINLGSNSFHGALPKRITTGSFAALSSFIIISNRVGGTIPDWIGELPRLERLSLQQNDLEGKVPKSLANAINLRFLVVHTNYRLTGPIPVELASLRKLLWLDMSNTGVSGGIPHWLGEVYTSLQVLVFRNCSLSGSIPASLGNLKHLFLLDLSYNDLGGSVPPSLGGCTWLTYLVLANNRLSGSVPVEIVNCTRLQQVLLQNNELSGEFEFDFRNVTSLTYLSVSNNSLTGDISKSLLSNPSFIFFDADRNKFVFEEENNTIDVASTSLSLRVLMLGHNDLRGPVPTWVWRFPVLQILDLSHNRLDGALPRELTQLQGFIDRNVAANRSIDTSVQTIEFNQDLALLVKGGIQKLSMSSWHFVFAMNLAENRFTGTIPGPAFGQLKALVYCNLSRNAFTGFLPFELGSLPLQSLDVSGNFLDGSIPEEFSNLTQLSTLRLANNHLSGAIPSGTQLQGFGNDSYLPGNDGLCGRPLSRICTISATPVVGAASRVNELDTLISVPAFVLGLALGFVSVGATYLWLLHPQLNRSSWRFWRRENYGEWRRPT